MEDLSIVVKQTNGTIQANFEDLRNQLRVQMSAYKDMAVSENEIADARRDLAFLRKLRKNIEDKRKEIKKSFMIPYVDFEDEVKKLLKEIDEPISNIDTQIKMFEEEHVIKKKKHCIELYNEMIGEYGRFLPFENIFNEKWTNASYSDTDIRYDISEKVCKVKNDIEVIKTLHSEIEDELFDIYINSKNDLSKVVARNQQYITDKQNILEKSVKIDQGDTEKSVDVQKPVEDINKPKMVKILISETDLNQVTNILDFSDIKYEIMRE